MVSSIVLLNSGEQRDNNVKTPKARKKALIKGPNKPYVTAGARGVRDQRNSRNFNLRKGEKLRVKSQ